MYVCICNAISERELRRAVELQGIRTVEAFFEARHIGPVCGTCLGEMRELLQRFAREAGEGSDGQVRVLG